jgi:hypothetical protein
MSEAVNQVVATAMEEEVVVQTAAAVAAITEAGDRMVILRRKACGELGRATFVGHVAMPTTGPRTIGTRPRRRPKPTWRRKKMEDSC